MMAHRIQAVTAYRPRLVLAEAASEEKYMEQITRRTTLSAGVVKNVQESEVETLIGLLLEGRPVHTGIAIYTPNIDLDGDLEIMVRVDKRLVRALNAAGAFQGRIHNAANIGKSAADLVEMWNEANPNDPVG